MEMRDALVRLYALPKIEPFLQRVHEHGIVIRRARAYEKHQVVEWVREQFSRGWASECEVCFARAPLSCFIATHEHRLVGFSCHEATCKNFFGPIGVLPEYRQRQVGAALLLSSMHAMAELGYAYAIIGGLSDTAPFYQKVVGAMDIPGSTPGIYVDRLVRRTS